MAAMPVFTLEDLAAHRKNDGAGAKSANRFLKRVRELLRGEHQADKNLWLVQAHLDITDLAPAEFDWRAWLAGRSKMDEHIIGPGIVSIKIASFVDCAVQYRMGRMDFLLERVNGDAVRLHPEKNGKECNPLVWEALDPQWLMLEIGPHGPERTRDAGRKTLGWVAAKAMGITYTGLEPPLIEFDMLEAPTWRPRDVGMAEEGGGGAPGPAAGGGRGGGGGGAPGHAAGGGLGGGAPGPAAGGGLGGGGGGAPGHAAGGGLGGGAPGPAAPAERWEWWPANASWRQGGRWYLWVEGQGWERH